ncbi:MAG: hypothetical protein AAB343_02935 [Patescibacteria group bacterium]
MKTNIIGLKELRENVEKYSSRVAKGEQFIVMRRSRPLFKLSPVDPWGDEGAWETVADFGKISDGGVSAKKVISVLKKLNG